MRTTNWIKCTNRARFNSSVMDLGRGLKTFFKVVHQGPNKKPYIKIIRDDKKFIIIELEKYDVECLLEDLKQNFCQ